MQCPLRLRFCFIASAAVWSVLLPRVGIADKSSGVEAGGIHWLANYQEARKMALRLHRLMIVNLETDWCTWCAAMDEDVFGDPEVSRQLGPNYIFVRKNAESAPLGVILQRRFHVFSYPATVVVEPLDELYVTIAGYQAPPVLVHDVNEAANELHHLVVSRERTRSSIASVQEREDLAQAYADRGLYRSAAELYDGLLRETALPNAPEYYFKLAVCRAGEGESAKALSTLEALEGQFPNSPLTPEAEALRGEIWFHAGDLGKAKKILSSWLIKYAKNPLADHVRSLLAQID
jgi:tetratricopeptide (TPR) repeat protein